MTEGVVYCACGSLSSFEHGDLFCDELYCPECACRTDAKRRYPTAAAARKAHRDAKFVG